jgi:hypothetical protein
MESSMHPWMVEVANITLKGIKQLPDEDARKALSLLCTNPGWVQETLSFKSGEADWVEAAIHLLQQGQDDMVRRAILRQLETISSVLNIVHPEEPAA